MTRRPLRWAGRMLAGSALAAAATLGGAGVAYAHVTVSPDTVARGAGDVVLTFRVPSELPGASTIGLQVQFPTDNPIALVSPEADPAWKVTVTTTHLARPVTTDDGTFSDVVSEIDWSGGRIPSGQFGEFSVLAQGIPSRGSRLVLKALQAYDNGQVVAWIEEPTKADASPEHPAPAVNLVGGGAGSGDQPAPTATATPVAGGPSPASQGGTPAAAVVALIAACFAVVVGLLAIWLARPRRPEDTDQGGAGAS